LKKSPRRRLEKKPHVEPGHYFKKLVTGRKKGPGRQARSRF